MEKAKLNVVKIGGGILENSSLLEKTIQSFKSLSGTKLLVHGGGKTATHICSKMGIPIKMLEGRRITDIPTLDVVTMVYAGLINKKLVCLMQKNGVNALGLSGADGNLIKASKRPVHPIDYGYVGDVESVNTNLICNLLGLNLVPVICALSHNQNGQLLNTNADTIARHLALSLQSQFDIHLSYVFEKPGVLLNPEDDQSTIPTLDQKSFQELKTKQIIQNGMIAKLDNAFKVIAETSIKVKLGSFAMLSQENHGTKLI